MLRVVEINAPADLPRLRADWARLREQTPGATFFQSLEWIEVYWQFFGTADPGRPAPRLRVLVVESEGATIGILPLVVLTENYRVGPLRVLGYPLHGWGSFYGPIGPEPAITLQTAIQHIRDTPRDWDLFDLRWVDESGVDRGCTSRALELADFKCDAQLWHTSAQIELDHGWEHYWRNRKSHWRTNVRRDERRLAELGTVEHLRYRPLGAEQGQCDPRWDLYDACVEIARRSWQGDSTTGTTLSHESVREYLRATHLTAANAGAVDLNLLLVNNQPVAFSYNYHYRGWVYGLRAGYLPSAGHEGAGTVLMRRMIEDSCRRGDRLVDLGPNYIDCKRHWLTRLQPAYHYTNYRRGAMRAQALRLKRIVKRWLEGSHRERAIDAAPKSESCLQAHSS